jgi:predicted O-methyltransferase YrrM
VAAVVGKEIFDYFVKNVGDDLNVGIKVIRGESVDVAKSLLQDGGPQDCDLIFIDADHSYDSVCNDIGAWLKHVSPRGVLCGHDWCEHFPDVERAVKDSLYPAQPKVIKDTSIWYITKADYDRAVESANAGVNHEQQSSRSK